MTNRILPGNKWGNEAEVVWLDDPSKYSYVRYYRVSSDSTDRPIRGLPDQLIGYTTLKGDAPRDAPGGKFYRRAFVLKKWDRDYRGDDRMEGHYLDCFPSQSVDPLTVAPGVKGFITDRLTDSSSEAREGL